MIEIWGRKNSSNVAPVMWAIGELGLQHQRHNVGGSFGGLDDEYVKINPNKKVPTIRDGDLYLWESNAIVRYLSYRYGSGSLAPNNPSQLAVADQWMEWCKTTLLPAFFPIFWQTIRVAPEQRDHKLVAASVDATARTLELLDNHLEHLEYVSGDTLTMGDIPFGSILYRYNELEIERPSLPNVERWYQKLLERPAFQQHVMIPFGKNLEEWNELERAGAD